MDIEKVDQSLEKNVFDLILSFWRDYNVFCC
jgi:hypothetical protein